MSRRRMNRAQIAAEIVRWFNEGVGEKTILRRLASLNADEETIIAATKIASDELRTRANQLLAESKAMQDIRRLFDGLPQHTSMHDAARIKAAQGDPLAQQLLEQFNSRERRLHYALVDAAAQMHPEWEKIGQGYRKIAGAPIEGDLALHQLVEWYQINYPLEARRIEASERRSSGFPRRLRS